MVFDRLKYGKSNHGPYWVTEEEQTTQWQKEKGQKDKQNNRLKREGMGQRVLSAID
jgi:hypothetical protein